MAGFSVSSRSELRRRRAHMLHAGLDLSRKRLDYCLLDEHGERVEVGAAPPDGDGLMGFARRVERAHGRVDVCAAIESMTGARFVHDTLERCGWDVMVADAVKVKGAGAVGVQDRPHRCVGARRAIASRSGSGDLAARFRAASGARASPLAAASGQASLGAKAPRALDADDVRARLSGQRPLRKLPAGSCWCAWISPTRGAPMCWPRSR